MNLKNLTIASMIVATQQWLNPQELLPLLQAYEGLRGFVPKLQRLLKDLLRLRPTQDTLDALLKEVGLSALATDRRHDTLAKALFLALEAIALSLSVSADADDVALGQALTALQGKLFPDQLSGLQRSFLEEVGLALRAAEALTDADRATLDGLAFGPQGRTLRALFDDWQAAAADLGTLESQREALLAKRAYTEGDGVTRGQIQAARSLWIRTVRALLASVEIEDGLPPIDRAKLRARLERLAAQAQAAQAASDDADSAPDPDPSPDAASDATA